ncbi:tryptophan synthase subunit alpha [Lachnoclostridium phytofermentans]|uniref:Tryptophan synthase alpha chain n=1 Tax=Lachnoclostridium phytofermentans (strain ATCC 700394 / DSM 18823 / ISDg) TaxID=357809 RepID=A9KL40_LACP7|nr:tryptophan synthase subunit alpha [Lachnoclostridium phytofermentans]ABX44189.1 tryptophan synthase, alpha subunit [Lachnoclostridium phytofermentans ISDg]
MTRIEQAFTKGKALITFITGGDPGIEVTEELIVSMAMEGADLIEIGIPFSDPIAEGPIIQEANERALKAGATTDLLFDMIGRVRSKVLVPLVFMTYINPIYTYGADRFLRRCKEVGIDGVIVPDLPYEEKEELLPLCKLHDITLISMIAPTSKERIQTILKEAEGFLYCVSSLGVTGVRTEIGSQVDYMIKEAKKVTDIPCAVGFGISTPEQAREMAEISDGVIVGSAIVDIIAKHQEQCVQPVTDFIKVLKKSICK